ncbi:MAG: tetratricopeptide repeat protein [Bacteroidetes bacterium]|nr:tetratricopeptide repeat protein [Bacteroidota bacterium]MBU1115745.1 tetratricopeptide repeat protein [Bacteroidota bacterium]MBU1799886.1 tetratricopeptide repeat protein [Bacteroidota bacterium]
MKRVLFLFLFITSQAFPTYNIKFNITIPSSGETIKFDNLVDFTVDSEGNIYFLDDGLAKIFCFDKEGKLQANKAQLKGNYLKEPISIEIAKNNNIYVLDQSIKKVLIYDAEGNFIKFFGNSDGYLGSFKSPIDMALGNNSNIYIVDEGNDYLLRFSSEGLFRGGIKIKNPISVDVDLRGNVHVLTKTDYNYVIEVYSENFEKKKNINLAKMEKANHFSINSFNEYYIIDVESGNAAYLDSTGKALTNTIGVKSSNKGRQQFSKPTRIISKSQNATEDVIYIMDNDFGELQSFTVTSDKPRNEIKPVLPKYDLKIVKDVKRIPAVDIYFDKSAEFTISTNNSIICTENGEPKYTITPQSASQSSIKLSEPVALTMFNGMLYVLDKDENKIFVFDASNGSYSFAFGESGSTPGKFDSPTDLVSDSEGNIYIADADNERVNVYTHDGIFKNEIKLTNIKPFKLSFSDSKLYILSENKEQIFVNNTTDNKFIAYPLSQIVPEPKLLSIESFNGGFLLFFNENDGSAYLLKNEKLFAQFISKGNDSETIMNVSNLEFDKNKNKIVFYDNKTQQQQTIKFSIAPKIPTNIKMIVNDAGQGVLTWSNDDVNSASYIISRKKPNDEKFIPLSETNNNSYNINYKNSNFIFEYVVQSVSADSFKSDFSKSVVDEYSYYLKLKETDAKQSIEKLLSVKALNEKAINNEIINIYSTVIRVANNENNYDLVLKYYDEMKKISPLEPTIYLEESNQYKKLMKFSEGVQKLEECVALIPDKLKIWSQLIRLKLLAKDYQGAEISCKSALSLFPDDEKLLVSLAESYSKLNKYFEASSIYKNLAIKYSNEDYYIKAGNLLVESNLIEDAINFYQLAENNGIEGAKLFAARGKALIEKGDFANAEFQIEKSIKLDNTNAETYYYLALANSKKRNMKAAIEAYDRSIKLDNTNYKVLLDYGADLVKLNNYEDAITAYERALELNTTSVEAAFNLGRIYARLKNLDLAVKHLTTANKLFPDSKEIESELGNALLAREKYNKSRPPIEITVIDFDDIFPSYLGYYSSQPIGSVTIFNTKNEVFDDISIEINAPGLVTSPATIIVPIIYPNEVSENLVYLQLDNSLITNSLVEDKSYDVTVTASYIKESKVEKIEKKTVIKVYQLNSISWEDKKHLASFINSRDEKLRSFVTSEIIAKTSFNDNRFNKIPKPILQAAQIWEYLRQMNLNYVQDPTTSYEIVSKLNSIDYVQFPNQTLIKKVGDCDDLVSLLSNLFEVLGIETAYIDVPGHVFLALNTGIIPSEIEENGLSDAQVIIKYNKVWLPLESTVIGKNSFVESWKYATDRYTKERESNSPIELVEIQNAAITYPPITFPNPAPIVNNVDVQVVKAELEKDLKSFKLTSDKTYEDELLKVLNSYPNNIFTFNKLGVYYAKKRNYESAEVYFTRTLQYEKENVVALTNLGNLGFLRKDYDYAERKYLSALKYDQQNVGILGNLVRCNLKQNKTQAAIDYYQKIEQINPDYAKKIKEIKKN